MTSSVRAKRAADQKAANRREEEMRLAKLEGRIAEAEEIVKQEAPEEPVAEKPAPAPKKKAAAKPTMTLAQLRAAAKKKGFKLVRA